MDLRKMGNLAQLRLAQEISVSGKRCVLARNGALELLFNADNALDIVWARYKGVNISFLSKNGLNNGSRDFAGNFEGGFLYTCGLDNVSSCIPGKPIHGSLHYTAAECVRCGIEDDRVVVAAEVGERALFGKNLVIRRRYEITEHSLFISDTVANLGFVTAEYTLLYHINYGYPFLDECLVMSVAATRSEPLTELSKANADNMFKITGPIDGGDEHVYYHTLSEGRVELKNPDLGISVEMLYDIDALPVTLEWKSMISGDYALGIEPSTTRFDDFKACALSPTEAKTYNIKINFKEISK